MLLEKVSIHSEDFVTLSLDIIIKKFELYVEVTKKESSILPSAYLGRIFNMILLPKRENKTGFCLVTPLQKLWGPGLTLQPSSSSLNGKPERTKTPPVGQPTSSSWNWSWYTLPRGSFYSVSAIVNSSGFTLNYPSLWNNITTGNICTGSVKIKTSFFNRGLSHMLVLWQLNVELPKDWIWQIWMQIQTPRESWKGFLVLGVSERYFNKVTRCGNPGELSPVYYEFTCYCSDIYLQFC